jgi:predicted nucleic acid-binding protein
LFHQDGIRHETEAILAILRRVIEGDDTLVWSWVLSFENDKHPKPKPDRRDEIALWEGRAERSVGLSADLQKRSRQIAEQGIHALDAAHLATAEAGGTEVFLTCDDLVLRRAPRLRLALRILNPVAYLSEVSPSG